MDNKGCPSEQIVLFFQHYFVCGGIGQTRAKIYVANYVHLTLSSFNATDIHLLVKKSVKKICNVIPINKGGWASTAFCTM